MKDWPHSPETVCNWIRVVLKHADDKSGDLMEHIKELRVRAHVVLGMARLYIHRHFDFLDERLTAVEIKERVRSLEAEVKTRIDGLYPADEGYHTEEGQLPKELQAQIEENQVRFKNHRVDVGPGIELKNQAMPDSTAAQEEPFQNVRPVAVLAEQDAGRLTELDDQKKFALSEYSTLAVKCTTRFEDQFNPLYINIIFPWSLCGENSGAEYPAFEIPDDAEDELLREHG